jgi:hypothetical protein
MFFGASLAFSLVLVALFVLRIALSVYNWYLIRGLNNRLDEIETDRKH